MFLLRDFLCQAYNSHREVLGQDLRICLRFLQTYAVPKRMYKKDGSVGQSEKYSGLNEKKLSLMKGDKVVKAS